LSLSFDSLLSSLNLILQLHTSSSTCRFRVKVHQKSPLFSIL